MGDVNEIYPSYMREIIGMKIYPKKWKQNAHRVHDFTS